MTATIMVARVIGALASGSLALLADAGHMFTDSAGLLIALIAVLLALRPATDKRAWGYKRAKIIAVAAQVSVLLAVGGFVSVEGVRQLNDALKSVAVIALRALILLRDAIEVLMPPPRV